MSYIDFSEAVWKEFLKLAREELDRAIEAQPEDWKRDRLVTAYPSPVRSLSPEELEGLIDSYVEVFNPETDYTDEELRVELLDRVKYDKLKVDTSLPTLQLQEAIRAELKGMSKEELLRVFPDYTEAEARKRKEEYIDMVVRMLKPISMHSAIKELTQEPTKLTDNWREEYLSSWTANIGELIPKGQEVGKDFYKLVLTGVRNRDLRETVKSYKE